MGNLWQKTVVVGMITMVLVLLLAVLPACTASPGAQVPKEITIGSAEMLTGFGASVGKGLGFGLQAAVDDINKQGGVYVKEYDKKIPFRLLIVDDQSDPIKTGTLTEDLIVNQKVNFLITASFPPGIASSANAAEKYKVPNVCNMGPFEPTNALRESAGGWNYTWGAGFAIGTPPEKGYWTEGKPGYTTGELWGAFLSDYINQTNKKTAVFASDDGDGRGWYEAIPGVLKALGLAPVGLDKSLGIAPMGTNDFTSVIKQWKENNCEIMVGNAPADWFGTMWRQCREMGYKPKMLIAERAAMIHTDVLSWGGDLPWGITVQVEWLPTIKATGIGDTTPVSLDQRWRSATGLPTHQLVGSAYTHVQVLADAIQRAGTLDRDKVNAALAKTDLETIHGRIVYDSKHFARFPVTFGQWFKTDNADKWEMKIIYSKVDFYPVTAKPIFPIP